TKDPIVDNAGGADNGSSSRSGNSGGSSVVADHGSGSGSGSSGSDRIAAVVPDADHAAIADAAPVADTEIEMEPDAGVELSPDATQTTPRDARTADAPVRQPPPPQPQPPKANLAELTANGVRELATGKYSAAVASFKKATAVSAGHTPAWRGLGIAYEKQGAKAQAISAFQRYLAIAPGAGDAQAIRDRIERLKK
ncbi:MAG: tetratricopeptide repeat protein, partial [Deltaproteobacteria bacterium]|nr:tetratricopeptide repeat protein [Deltaproteobacteria bacterium]